MESRLELYAGDWWENPAWGNEILKMLQEGRLTNADVQALSTYLTEYVRETSGVSLREALESLLLVTFMVMMCASPYLSRAM